MTTGPPRRIQVLGMVRLDWLGLGEAR